MKDNELGFRTSEYDYWDNYKEWLKQLKAGNKQKDTETKELPTRNK